MNVEAYKIRGGKELRILIILVLGLLYFGGILVYKSLKKDFVLVIKADSSEKKYPLAEFRKINELDSFLIEIKEKTGDKLTILS